MQVPTRRNPSQYNNNTQEINVEDFGNSDQNHSTMTAKPKLIHPALHDIPQDLRFVISGTINTIGFMLTLWIATVSLTGVYSSSAIYSFSNLFYIPVGHAISSLLVFGWPTKYVQNLLMNAPIGLTGTVIGTACTEVLDRNGFDAACYNLLKRFIIVDSLDEGGSMFTSLLVVIITGIWGYILSNFINSSPKPKKGDKQS